MRIANAYSVHKDNDNKMGKFNVPLCNHAHCRIEREREREND